jgi:NAD(P)-dependent dehydrogenase (short-subunit alcohol dehydrogenase family)
MRRETKGQSYYLSGMYLRIERRGGGRLVLTSRHVVTSGPGVPPLGRWGDVQGLVGAAVFLASDASSFVNGHVLGGVTARL